MNNKTNNNALSLNLLKELTQLSGVSGNESQIRKFMEKELGKISDQQLRDHLGSIAFEFKGQRSNPKILVIGHLDEIGFMVHSISKNGLINFTSLGGWDPRTLMSSPVEIINQEGEKVIGLIGSVPVHHLKDTTGKLSLDEMYIDIGAENDEEVQNLFKIRKGNFIVPVSHFAHIEKKNCLISKAFDDRVGIAVTIEVGKYFHNVQHPNTIYCAGSVQEEVGTRGAMTIVNLIKPDLAIVLEGAPGDDFPRNSEEMQAKKNGGVQLRMIDPTMIANPNFINFAIEIAEKSKIPYQIAVRKSGGTDAGKIHISHLGVPTIVLAAPVRYAHSHNGMLSWYDYQAVYQLTISLLEKLDNKVFQKILD